MSKAINLNFSRFACMLVALPCFITASSQQISPVSSSVYTGSPGSFCLNPKCSHTGAVLETKPTVSFHHLLYCVRLCVGPTPTLAKRLDDFTRSVHSAIEPTRPGVKTNKRANLSRLAKWPILFSFTERLIDVLIIATGLLVSLTTKNSCFVISQSSCRVA